jgi:hypothetical protein
VNPFDVDARTTGSGAGSIERNLGDVQSAHLPILAGQSDGVSPFAAADVERMCGGTFEDFPHGRDVLAPFLQ